MRSLEADLCVMAYVTLFVPQPALDAPKLGTIQYHPSLLPRHRGPSSINWPIIQGETKTGLSIFWPNEGLDEGPILLQKEVEIGPDDTLGSLYFNRLFPMGVDAMVEAIDLVRAGKAPRIEQDEKRATYESWCRKADAKIDWNRPAAEIYNLIRGTDPQPGAWTVIGGNEVQVYDSAVSRQSGAPGNVVSVTDDGFEVAAADGSIVVQRVRPKGGKKMSAGEFAKDVGLSEGTQLDA
jgi:methionyl-tRNA formyltransferase